jgi:membrane-bound metal-dependent hydrolase YbcI (DUF457 family)
MPSPAGHFLFGLTLHIATAPRDHITWRPRAITVVAAALLPDADLLLKFVDGRNHHQAESHSLGCAVAAGLIVFLAALMARARSPASLGAAALTGWASHVFLDYFGRDTHPPIGLQALWPLSDGFFKSPFPLFLDIGRTLEWIGIRNNAVAVAWEMVALCPLLVVAWRLRTRQGVG